MIRAGLLLLILFGIEFLPLCEANAKVRLTSSAGFSLKNEFSSKTAGIYGGALHLLYPVSDTKKTINTEIGAASWYNYYTLTEKEMQTIRFGLAIRVYFNISDTVIPFFTHDILSQITYLSDRKNSATTYSIILGLGAKIPQKNDLISALFSELTYSRFRLAFFEIKEEYFSFISFNFGSEF